MRAKRWGAVAGAVALAVLAASFVPGSTGAAGSLPPGADKLLHFVGYAVLSFSVAAAVRARAARTAVAIVVAVTVLGAGVELLQPLVDRTASLLDATANLAGATAGALVWRLVTAPTADSLAD